MDGGLGVGAGHSSGIRGRDVQDARSDRVVNRGSAGRYLGADRIQVGDAALGNRFAVKVSRDARYETRLLDGNLGLASPAFRFRTGFSRGAGRARSLWEASCK